MTSRADLKRLVKKGFMARTLVNAFGGTVHRQKGYTGDTDFVISYKRDSGEPAGSQIGKVLTHEFEGKLGCEIRQMCNHKWDCILTIVNIHLPNSTSPALQLVLSYEYPIRTEDGRISSDAIRISTRLLK